MFGKKSFGKRGISPLVATILLVAFAVALGSVVMSWAQGIEEDVAAKGSCNFQCTFDEPLQQLMVRYLNGEVNKQQFFQQVNVYR
jgi:flagellin-like protein